MTSSSSCSWPMLTLGEVCTTITDGAHHSPKSVDQGIPMASVKDLTRFGINLDSCRLISPHDYEILVRQGCRPLTGDILIAKDGASALDTVCIVREVLDVVLLSSVAILRPDQNIVLSLFLKYYLDAETTREYMKNSFISGAAIPRVVLKDFKLARIPLPFLPTQKKIASILSTYDDLIENNLRRIKILEEMAQNLYREWFVKFRFPGYENVKFVDSPLGKIPEGWEVNKLGNDIELSYGKSLRKDKRIEGDVPVYGSSGVVGYHNEPFVDGPGIILGRKGNVGSVYWSDHEFYPIDTVYYIQTDIPLDYVYYNLQEQNFLNNDAAVPGLNRNQAYSLPFIKPPIQLLVRFQALNTTFFDMVRCLKKQNENLKETRDLLLPRLISGELDVSELDIKIPEDTA